MTRILRYLRHPVEIRRTTYGAPDPEGSDYGHGTAVVSTVGSYRGLIQPRTASERATATGEGAVMGRYRGFLEAAAIGLVDVDDVVRKTGGPAPDLDGDYRITDVANAAGVDHHLELELERLDA